MAIFWDPSPELIPWNLPIIDRPILWYGFFFAFGFFLGYLVFQNLLKEFMRSYRTPKKEVNKICERMCGYVVLGTLIGARLGDVFFYQNLKIYAHHWSGILKFWEGGLSSHGAIAGILISLFIFAVRLRKTTPMLTWIAMLDLLVIPGLIAGACIRLGNFFNQEILGTVTNLPWAVVFGHPADGSLPMARHPVQLYEALFYLSFFALLWTLRARVPKMFRLGKTSGLFFIVTFAFRFLIEFVKSPQSTLIAPGAMLDMGQWLSIPLIGVGIFLFFFSEQSSLRMRSVKNN